MAAAVSQVCSRLGSGFFSTGLYGLDLGMLVAGLSMGIILSFPRRLSTVTACDAHEYHLRSRELFRS